MKPIKLKDMGIEEKLMRGILNNLYQDANAMTMFDATIANFSVGNALKKLGSLELKGYIKVEDIDWKEMGKALPFFPDFFDSQDNKVKKYTEKDIAEIIRTNYFLNIQKAIGVIKAKLKKIAGIKD